MSGGAGKGVEEQLGEDLIGLEIYKEVDSSNGTGMTRLEWMRGE